MVRVLLAFLFISAVALAAPAAATEANVGRISLVDGPVAFRAAGDSAASKAEVNAPVAAGTSIRTDPHARAELRIGDDDIQLAGDTDLEIGQLSNNIVEIVLRQGRIGLRLRRLDDGETVQLDLPKGGLWLLQPGSYDIDAGQPVRVAAYDGRARFVGGGADLTIDGGEAAVLNGTAELAAAVDPAKPDDFAAWCRSRDYDETALAAPYFVSPEMTGYEQLDGHGSWEGAVWYPNGVDADWAPYRYGHWRWIAPWGWTWIDDHPWGFATSHYGRWAHLGERWGWVPGRWEAHPPYAPALVAFLGTPGVGLSVADSSVPAIAWFPLAPGEVYWPSYSADLNYVRRLNVANVSNIDSVRLGGNGELPVEVFNEHFANREFASAVRRNVFAGGGAVAPALLHLPEQRLVEAPVIMGSPQVTATIAATKPAAAPKPVATATPGPEAQPHPVQQVTIVRPAPKPAPHPTRVAVRGSRLVVVHAGGSHPRAPAFVHASPAGRGQTAQARVGRTAPTVVRGPRPAALHLAHAGHSPRR